MSGLKPCPFCGGEAHVKEVVGACDTLYTVGCSDSGCMGYETWLLKPTEEEAIAAWNRRAGRTCRVGCYPPGYEDNLHHEVCSECGTILTASRPGDSHAARASYCPNCGA